MQGWLGLRCGGGCDRRANRRATLVFCVTRDITERKQAEELLRESQARLELATRATQIGPWDWDLRTNDVYLSPEWKRQIGYEDHEIAGRYEEWESRLHPEDRDRVLAHLHAYFGGERPDYELEFRLRHKDGSYRWIFTRGEVLLDAAGKPYRMFGCHLDITERKQAEEKLWQSLNLLRAITEGTTDSIFAKDRPGRYLMLNTVGARFVGKTPEEAIGLEDSQVFSGNTLARILERDRAVMKTGETRTDEDITTTLAGLCRVYLTTKGPLRDSTGAIIGLVGISRDVTERKREEEKLRESEQRFRQLAENIDNVFWIWTMDQQQLLYVSPAYETIFGRSCDSLHASPTSWREAIHPEDKERVIGIITNINERTPVDITYRIVRPDGCVRWVRDRTFPVRDDKGAVVRFAGVADDITEIKQAEGALLVANRQLQILSRRRAQVQEDERKHLARELHDQIGQAITAAKISLQTAEGAKQRKAMAAEVGNTIGILDQVLEQVRRIAFGLRSSVLDDLGLAAALRSSLNDFSGRAGWTVEFHADTGLERPEAEVETACYRIALEALANIMRHAKAKRVVMELRQMKDGFELSIRDDGVGFDAADTEKQAQSDRLGLIGMRERALAVGGQFEIRPVKSRGTEVRAVFPISSKPDAPV